MQLMQVLLQCSSKVNADQGHHEMRGMKTIYDPFCGVFKIALYLHTASQEKILTGP